MLHMCIYDYHETSPCQEQSKGLSKILSDHLDGRHLAQKHMFKNITIREVKRSDDNRNKHRVKETTQSRKLREGIWEANI